MCFSESQGKMSSLVDNVINHLTEPRMVSIFLGCLLSTFPRHFNLLLLLFQLKVDPAKPVSLTWQRGLNTEGIVLSEFGLTMKEMISLVMFVCLFILYFM